MGMRGDEPPSGSSLEGRDPQAALERRATVRLHRYWMALRRVGIAPAFQDFDPRRNPVPWENCFLARVGQSDREVAFEHVGHALWIAFDRAVPDDPRSAGLPDFLGALIGELGTALSTGQPAERNNAYALAGRRVLLFRSILLPFVDADRQPRYALGAATFRIAPAPP